MDSHHVWCITFTTLIYLACLLHPATAKCTGRWKIQACIGGMGKRSDVLLNEIENRPRPSLLRQTLLRELSTGERRSSEEDIVQSLEKLKMLRDAELMRQLNQERLQRRLFNLA